MATEEVVLQLLDFLHQPALEVRAIALNNVIGFTAKNSEFQPLLISKRETLCKDLKALCREDPITAHDAIKALINLSADPSVQQTLNDAEFVRYLVLLITISKSILADPACMLLSNMTRYEPTCVKLLEAEAKPMPGLSDSKRALDHLVEAFHVGHNKEYNEQANFKFLSSVFSNLSIIHAGRMYLLEPAPHDQLAPLTKLQIFSEDRDVIRRGGVCSVMKNCCFESHMHKNLLDADKLNTLPFILLPLCGSEEYDMDEFEKFPEEIQLLGDDKKRETDVFLREVLLDAVLRLTESRFGRDYLRDKQVYRVVQRLDVQETDNNIKEKCVRIVDMLIRDEEEAKITPVNEKDGMDEDEDEDEDFAIEEIV